MGILARIEKPDIWNYIDSVSQSAEIDYPPVISDDVNNFLVNRIATNIAELEKYPPAAVNNVVRKSVRRYAEKARHAHYDSSDHYLYWPSEIRRLAEDFRYQQERIEAADGLLQLRQWGVDPSQEEVSSALSLPNRFFRREIFDECIARADIKAAAQKAFSNKAWWTLSSDQIQLATLTLNGTCSRCDPHSKGFA